MVIHKNYHLIVTKDFSIFYLPSSSHAYDSFTLGVKSQSIVYLLSGCEHIYIYIEAFGPWNWGALNMGFVNKGNLQEYKGTFF